MSEDTVKLEFDLNGERTSLSVPPTRRLVDVLRDDLGLTGTKVGCAVGVCGTCTVLLDDQPVSSCLTVAAHVDGREISTVEGTGAELGLLQQAFIEEGGFQCGYCTSGQLMAATAVLRRGDLAELTAADVCHELVGNLCRCTGYYGILRAVRRAQRAIGMTTADASATGSPPSGASVGSAPQ